MAASAASPASASALQPCRGARRGSARRGGIGQPRDPRSVCTGTPVLKRPHTPRSAFFQHSHMLVCCIIRASSQAPECLPADIPRSDGAAPARADRAAEHQTKPFKRRQTLRYLLSSAGFGAETN